MMAVIQSLRMHFYQQLTWKKILPVLVYLCLYNLIILNPYRHLAERYQETYPISILAILTTSYWYVAIVMIGAILFFSALPFRDSFQFLLVIKIGYGRWLISQVLYILVGSVFFVATNAALTLLLLLPHLNGRLDSWGKLLNSLSQGRVSVTESLEGSFNRVAMQYYTPSAALIQSLLLFWLLVVLIGMVILTFNQLSPNLGLMLSCGLVVESIFYFYASGNWMQFLSPLNWVSIYRIKYEPHSGLPSLENVCLRLVVLYVVLLGILALRVKTRKVRVK